MTVILDDNSKTYSALDTFSASECSPDVFTGGIADTRGNDGGSNDPYTLYTVTGEVLVRIFGVCTTSLEGGTATIEIGVSGNTAALISQTTATDIDANDLWNDATPTVGTDILANLTGPHLIINGLDIIETVATSDITAGNIRYVCLWRPISRDGNVVSAV